MNEYIHYKVPIRPESSEALAAAEEMTFESFAMKSAVYSVVITVNHLFLTENFCACNLLERCPVIMIKQ